MFTITSDNRRDIPVAEQIVAGFHRRIDLFGDHKLCFYRPETAHLRVCSKVKRFYGTLIASKIDDEE